MTTDDPTHLAALATNQEALSDEGRDGRPLDGLAEENLRILDAVFHEAGVIASEDPSPPTAEELDDEAAVGGFLRRLTASNR
jgi:hypothetical protein